MSISAEATYRLVYAQAPFAQHIPFLQGLRTRFAPSVEIPYLDALDLPEEALEAVDQYLYVLNDGDGARMVAAVKAAAARGRAFPGRLEDLGVVRGREVAGMLARFRSDQESVTDTGSFYRIQSGPLRNLIVRATGRDPQELLGPGETLTPTTVAVEYTLPGFRRKFPLLVETANIVPTRTPVDPLSTFTNKLTTARHRRAVILDADVELREACCRVDNRYSRPDPSVVQAAIDAGEEPPKWGEYVGGAEGFYFTVSRFRYFYPEFELHVVFDEREGGPRAGQGSPSFESSFAKNRAWVKDYVRACGLHVYETPGQRSEDVIASLVKRMEGDLDYREIVIATKGSDLYPLASARTRLTLPKINFRDHPQTITVPDAVQKFGLSDASQLPRIFWLRALTGDVVGTPSVNLYNKEAGHRYTSIRQADYLPHVLSASSLSDLKLRLLAFEAFHPFVHSGQFDRNLQQVMFDASLLDNVPDLSGFRTSTAEGIGQVDFDATRRLLRASSFEKEIEFLPLGVLVIAGLW